MNEEMLTDILPEHNESYDRYMRRNRAARLAFGALLLALPLSGYILGEMDIIDPIAMALISLAAFTLIAVVAIFLMERAPDRLDIFHPCYLVLLSCVMNFLGPAVYNYRSDFFPADDLPYVQAHYCVIMGFGAFILGFFAVSPNQITPPRWLNNFSYPAPRMIIVAGILGLLAVSLGSSFQLIHSAGGLGSYLARLGLRLELFEGEGVLLSLSLLGTSAFVLSYVHFLVSPVRALSLPLLIGCFGVAVVLSILSGSRSNLLTVLLVVMIVWHYSYRRIRLVSAAVIGVALLSLAFAYIALVRQKSVSDDFVGASGPRDKLSLVYNNLFGQGTFIELNSVARVLESMPDLLPYQYGRTYLDVLTFPIPRSFFADKSRGASELYTKAVRPEIWDAGRADRITFFGEALVNFGIPGLLAISGGLGALAGYVYTRTLRCQDNPFVVVLFAYMMIWLMLMMVSDSSIATWMELRLFLPILVIWQLAKTKAPLEEAES